MVIAKPGFSMTRVVLVVLVVAVVSASGLYFALSSGSQSISTSPVTITSSTTVPSGNSTTNSLTSPSQPSTTSTSASSTNRTTSSVTKTSSATSSSTSVTANPLCTSQPCAPMISGWLHTEAGSTSVYDSSGNAVPLVGVNVDGLDFGIGNPATSPDPCGKGWSISSTSYANVPSWGFNFVRIPISWENLEPTAPTLAANGTWIHH